MNVRQYIIVLLRRRR